MMPVIRESTVSGADDAPIAAAPDAATRPAGVVPLWLGAAGVGALGAAIMFDAVGGLNWTIWTIVAATGLALMTYRARGRLSREIAMVLLLSCVLAGGATVNADPVFQVLIVAGVATLLAIAMLVAGDARLDQGGLRFLALAPLVGCVRAGVEAIRRAFEGVELMSAKGGSAALRGTLIALPVVAALALLLSQADPLLAAMRADVMRAIDGLTFLPRVIFFVALGGLSLGAYGIALRPHHAAPRVAASGVPAPAWLGDTERLIVLGSVSALFALFVLLQFAYFFGNLAGAPGSGITYAEYARRGFGELSVAASLATGLIVGLDQIAKRGTRERMVRIVSLVLIGLVQLLLDSAYHRVSLYEQAYGYTTSRLYAQVYMVVVSLALAVLTWEVCVTIDVKRLVRRTALLGTCALIALTYWNHEAWIVRRNVARAVLVGKVDPDDLVNAARFDALNVIPALVESLPRLDPATRVRVRSCLLERNDDRMVTRARTGRWYEWNLARRDAVRSLYRLSASDGGLASGRAVACHTEGEVRP